MIRFQYPPHTDKEVALAISTRMGEFQRGKFIIVRPSVSHAGFGYPLSVPPNLTSVKNNFFFRHWAKPSAARGLCPSEDIAINFSYNNLNLK